MLFFPPSFSVKSLLMTHMALSLDVSFTVMSKTTLRCRRSPKTTTLRTSTLRSGSTQHSELSLCLLCLWTYVHTYVRTYIILTFCFQPYFLVLYCSCIRTVHSYNLYCLFIKFVLYVHTICTVCTYIHTYALYVVHMCMHLCSVCTVHTYL